MDRPMSDLSLTEQSVTRRHHHMPFGAEFSDCGVLFRLWAPKHATVRVKLEDTGTAHPMRALVDGWHELRIAEAWPGTRYRFILPNGVEVPDPASRIQPQDVHGPSEVIAPNAFSWTDEGWTGRDWEECVIYELHVGTFTVDGTFRGEIDRLDDLRDLGISAIELMPVADFPGQRNWGYDGVLLFAPDSSYGRPENLKQLVDAAHARGIAVILDVVYNHFCQTAITCPLFPHLHRIPSHSVGCSGKLRCPILRVGQGSHHKQRDLMDSGIHL
jgi:malto-oligosyltrehalose trehalohydrolase